MNCNYISYLLLFVLLILYTTAWLSLLSCILVDSYYWRKGNNEECIKIKKSIKEVKCVLIDSKVLLQFALASVIESIRINPDKYNNLLGYDLQSSGLLLYIEDYKDTILDEDKRLYDKLLNHFTNSIIDNVGGISSFNYSLSSTFPNLSNQHDMDRMDNSESFLQNKKRYCLYRYNENMMIVNELVAVTNKKLRKIFVMRYLIRIMSISYCIRCFCSYHVHTAALGSTNIWPTMFGKCTWQMYVMVSGVVCYKRYSMNLSSHKFKGIADYIELI